jgi:hypothetical protein
MSVLLEGATMAKMAVLITQPQAVGADPLDVATILAAMERLPDGDAPDTALMQRHT